MTDPKTLGELDAQRELLLILYARWAEREGVSRVNDAISEALDKLTTRDTSHSLANATPRKDHSATYLAQFAAEIPEAAADHLARKRRAQTPRTAPR